jgi:hypothetical protein
MHDPLFHHVRMFTGSGSGMQYTHTRLTIPSFTRISSQQHIIYKRVVEITYYSQWEQRLVQIPSLMAVRFLERVAIKGTEEDFQWRVVLRNTMIFLFCFDFLGPDPLSSHQNHLRGSELGDSFGSFGDGVFGQLTRKHETNRGLDFSGGEGGLLVVTSKTRGFRSNSLEDIVDEGVHDGHSSLGDSSVWVNLFQHFVDVAGIGFHSLLVGFASGGFLWGFHTFLSWSLGHCCSCCLFLLLEGGRESWLSLKM